MKSNLNAYDRGARFLLGVFLVFSALAFFEGIFLKIVVILFGAFSLLEAISGFCLLYKRLGLTNKKHYLSAEAYYLIASLGTQIILGYEWLSAGWEKISNPEFVGGMGKTLGYFASQNPFIWYKDFLVGFASRNADLLGYAVEWSQLVIGVTLIFSAFIYAFTRKDSVKNLALLSSFIGLIGGLMMNANFYLAAGWTGPATHGINVVMFWMEALLAYVWLGLLLSRK